MAFAPTACHWARGCVSALPAVVLASACHSDPNVTAPAQPARAVVPTTPPARVRCGDEICSGDKPACFWSGSAGECVASGDNSAACTSDTDCGPGYRCCYAGSFSFCGGSCGSHATPLCKTKKDCSPKASLQPQACEPTAVPGMSPCVY